MAMEVPEDEVAYHEAGHAVVSAVLGSVPATVSIVPERGAAGFSGSPTGLGGPGVLDQIVVSFAGHAAHLKYAPGAKERAMAGAETDIAKARRCMMALGLSHLHREALERHQLERASTLVTQHWGAIQRVAQELIRVRVIESERLKALIAGASGG